MRAASKKAAAQLQALSDAQLLQEYNDPGHLLDLSPYQGGGESPRFSLFTSIGAEIVRRGARMAPSLNVLLRQELTRHRLAPTPPGSGIGNWYAPDLINLLAQIRTPEAAEALLKALDGTDETDKHEGRYYRADALRALERLTYCSPFGPGASADQAVSQLGHFDTDEGGLQAAQFYRAWLAGEGHDSKQWLPLARHRARVWLMSSDMDGVMQAASFLCDAPLLWLGGRLPLIVGPVHDDQPSRTVKQLAAQLARFKTEGVQKNYAGEDVPKYVYRGKVVSDLVVRGLWQRLASFGPHVRPYIALLIQRLREFGLDHDYGLGALSQIGGPQAAAYLVECAPKIEANLAALGLDHHPMRDAPLDFNKLPQDKHGQELIFADRACRFGFDRLAGRPFDSNRDRVTWWESNKGKTPEQWLRANVAVAAAEADAGSPRAQALIREALPDLPRFHDEEFWSPFARMDAYSALNSPTKTSARSQWLKEHWGRLHYDAAHHTLRVR